MRIVANILGSLALAIMFCAPARAQTDTMQNLTTFLTGHPEMASALSANPSLYRSPAFMNENPSLWSYLTQNPSVYQSVVAKAPTYRPDANAYAFSEYLHLHPGVAQLLNAHPGLVNDPAFLAKHPQLREFLQHHPSVKREFVMRGWSFAEWQRYHPWTDREKWRYEDDWSARAWQEQWERQHRHVHEPRRRETSASSQVPLPARRRAGCDRLRASGYPGDCSAQRCPSFVSAW